MDTRYRKPKCPKCGRTDIEIINTSQLRCMCGYVWKSKAKFIHRFNLNKNAYTEGFDAAHSGKSAAQCPYPYNSILGERWMLGYQDGGGRD